MDGRIKEYYFDEINNMDDFDSIFEDEMEAMYQPIVDEKAAKMAAKDLSEEFIEETESDSLNDDTYGI